MQVHEYGLWVRMGHSYIFSRSFNFVTNWCKPENLTVELLLENFALNFKNRDYWGIWVFDNGYLKPRRSLDPELEKFIDNVMSEFRMAATSKYGSMVDLIGNRPGQF